MKLSIIIISYNVKAYIKQCVHSILKSNYNGKYEIIIVDNFSYDYTADMIKKNFPKIKLIENKENLGYAKAVNIGINASKGDYICILNPDTLVSDNTFSILIKYLSKNIKTGCIGPKILNPNGSLQLACKRSFPTIFASFCKFIGLSRLFPNSKLFGKYNLTYLDENKIHEVDAISGSFMLFPKKIINKIGKFDEDFFMYGEDLDFCYRVIKSGLKIIYNPQSTIIHYKGESSKKATFDVVEIFYTAIVKFYNKHSNDYLSWKIFKNLIYFGIMLRKIITYINNYLRIIISGIIDLCIIIFSFMFAMHIWYTNYYNEIVTFSKIISHKYLLLNMLVSWIVSSILLNLYKKNSISYGRAIIVSICMFALSATSTYFISFIAYSRAVLIISCIFTVVMVASWRIAVYILYRYSKINITLKTPLFSRRAIILGTDTESMRIGKILENSLDAHFILIGFVDNLNKSKTNNFIGRLKDINCIVSRYKINEIIIPENYFNIRALIQLLGKLSNRIINYKLVPEGEKMLIGKGYVENIAGIPLLDFDLPLFDKMNLIGKRIFDIIISIILIIFTFPIHAYFLLSNRYKKINIWSIDNSQVKVLIYDSKYKIINDMPFLFNILRGSMSLVGSKIVNTNKKNPNIMIKPGLTGLPHIKINSNNNSRKFEHYYALHHSFIFDIEILLKSIFKI